MYVEINIPLYVKTFAVVDDKANNTGLEISPSLVGSTVVTDPAIVVDKK